MSEMPPQHPAAPETETDANGLRDALADHFVMWHDLPRANVPGVGNPPGEWRCHCGLKFGFSDSALDHQAEMVATAVRERVRVVEGERDAWRRERDEYVSSICFETTCTNCAHMLDQLAATQELVDGDHIEAAKSQRIKAQQGALAILRTDRNHWQSRAESAEAAHEAEKAAHEEAEQHIVQLTESRDRAEAAHERLRAGLEALADEWSDDTLGRHINFPAVRYLRSLLGGGEAR